MMPQNAQKDAIAVDKTTAIQPTIREALEGGDEFMASNPGSAVSDEKRSYTISLLSSSTTFNEKGN
jgi:hypothetical protein